MGISVAHQTQCFLLSLLLGAALGVLFDFFRILRLALPSPRWLVSAEDLLYFVLAAWCSLRFMLFVNQGEVRSFILVGEILGWVLYFFTMGQIVIKAADGVLRFLSRWLLRPIARLLGKIFSIFRSILRFLEKIRKKLCRNRKFSLKRHAILLYNLRKTKKASSD